MLLPRHCYVKYTDPPQNRNSVVHRVSDKGRHIIVRTPRSFRSKNRVYRGLCERWTLFLDRKLGVPTMIYCTVRLPTWYPWTKESSIADMADLADSLVLMRPLRGCPPR
eukprot:gene26681-biopygen4509